MTSEASAVREQSMMLIREKGASRHNDMYQADESLFIQRLRLEQWQAKQSEKRRWMTL